MEQLRTDIKTINVNDEDSNTKTETGLNATEIAYKEDTQISEENVYQYPTFFTNKTLLELSNSSWSKSMKCSNDVQPYLRGCKWSPDGTCCLCVVNNDGVHLTELSRDLYAGSVSPDRTIDVLDSILHIKESGLIYDFCWYPGMNSTIPETCCWLTTKQNSPIQMWDAFLGSLICSYRGFNEVDEMEPAISVTFSTDGSKIIAGYKKKLRTFDVHRPGRDFSEHKISSAASCFATYSNLLAVGSWNTTVSLYNINETGTYKSIGKIYGHGGGVTHMKFCPDGLRLVTGARKDHRLLVWDIRYYRQPLNILPRFVDTNQRVYFDISPCGKYLVTGGTDGVLKVWDATKQDWKYSPVFHETDNEIASLKFPLHKDCCNSVSIHPCRPILATGSGQYHFTDPASAIDGSSESLDNGQSQDGAKDNSTLSTDIKYSNETENCLVFWWIGALPDLT